MNSHAVIKEPTRDLNMHRKAGPFLTPPFTRFVRSPLDAIPKKHSTPQRFRVIHDLSWPSGRLVNDFVPSDKFTCQYDSLDRAIFYIKQAGPAAQMAKLDLSDAYRHILVQPDNWLLLGFTWPISVDGHLRTGYFFDMFLPFGAWSAPALFLQYTDALAFVMADRGSSVIWHYLDDFFTCGPAFPSTTCHHNLDVMVSSCQLLNFTLNPNKLVQPTTCLTLLGI